MKTNVLLVEDETDVIDLVKYHLHRAGFHVLTAETGDAGLELARKETPDLAILDIMLPGMNGLEVCRELRKTPATAAIPIIMLTAKGEQSDRIQGLETGADDYLAKPFSPRELVLRVQALLRRSESKPAGDALLQVDEFSIDRSSFQATINNQRLDLTTTELKLLSLLLERRGKIQSRETLLHEVWGYQNAIDTRTVDTHMRRLREKLGAHATRIETVRGSGYRFVPTTAA